MTLEMTGTDFFCGAGGSSKGLSAAGIEVKGAANHWPLAIQTHNTNFPDTEHYLDDLQKAHPSWYPRTTIAWFSPSCTNHSLAKGKKRKGINQLDLWGESGVDPAEEKSRATMREVVEFTEYHRYEAVIVENVVDVRKWQYYDEWIQAMTNLGYAHKILYINAQFFGVPQSRDRFYAVFWKKGNRAPNLDFRPPAACPRHGVVGAVQVWKKPEFPWGRYGNRRQYTYRCPHCGTEVMPAFRPAADVIDWSIPSQKIGDRKKPLEPKTIQRILAGLKKFGRWPHVADIAYQVNKVTSISDALPAQTTRQTLSLVEPFITSQHLGRDAVRGVDRELPCITTMNNEHQLVTPPFITTLRGPGEYLPGTSIDEPLTTIIAAAQQQYLVEPFLVEFYGKSVVRDVNEPLATITSKGDAHHGLLTPFITSLNHSDVRNTPVNQPVPTIMPHVNPALIISYYGQGGESQTVDPLPTVTTKDRFGLLTPEDVLPECGFRMLTPEELKLGMSFPASYIILGSKRDQVKQVGNAVCCLVAQAIAERLVESLAS